MIQSKLMVLLSLFAPEHILLIAFVVLLLFGGRKIPELMKGLGKGIREFNEAKTNVKSEIEAGIADRTQQTNVISTPIAPQAPVQQPQQPPVQL